MNSGYVFSPDEILPTQEELVERAMSLVLPISKAGFGTEPGEVRLDHLDGQLVAACDVIDGCWNKCRYELIRAGEHFIVRETIHNLNSMAAYEPDLYGLTTRHSLIPSAQGEAFLAVDGLIRTDVFERVVRDGAARQNWQSLSLLLTTGAQEMGDPGGASEGRLAPGV